ncbi:MAG TPA: PAS domain S-box protein, partial [Candidatus Omnitrophota bacterium]|nr:PAS domain S-box protein [Candidatus Omnitrophota bacterium]
EEWTTFVQKQNLESRFPGISAFRYIERVKRRSAEIFIRSVRQDRSVKTEGYPLFTIYPEGERDEYYVVNYLEPNAESDEPMGFDISTDPVRMKALIESMQTEMPVATGIYNQVTGTGNQVGFSIVLPVYANDMAHTNIKEREAALVGFVQSSFRSDDLLSGIFGKRSVHPEIGFQVFDGPELRSENLLYDDDSVLHVIYPNYRPRFTIVRDLNIAGRIWSLRFTALPKFGLEPTQEKLPLIVLFGGTLFSLLIFGTLYSFATSRSQAVRIAQGMTSKLRESERRYANLIEGAPDPIITLDRLGNLRSMNPAAEKVSGYRAEELVGKYFGSMSILTTPSFARALKEFALIVVGQERPPLELDFIRKDGTVITMEANPRPIKHAGKTESVQVIFRDMTERKLSEKALKENEERFRAVSETAHDAIISADTAGNMIYLNRAAALIFGYKPEEVYGKPISILMPERFREEHQTGFRRYLSTGESRIMGRTVEMAGLRKNAEEFPLEISLASWETQKGRFFTAVIRDITQKKKQEEQERILKEELERRAQALEAANRELEAFSYSVSHDLRAPLRAISGFAAALLEECHDRLSEEGKRFLVLIGQNAKNMGHLIDDLLAFSRMGRKAMDLVRIDMTALARTVSEELRSSASSKSVEVQIDPLEPAFGDPAMIHQIFVNLISNAIKFSGKEKSPKIRIQCIRSNDDIVYSVRDNGVGFDMQYSKKLFGVFQRLHSLEEFEGTGVGLAIVQRIVHRHGGRVWAESKPGEGAVFYFTLPVKPIGNYK